MDELFTGESDNDDGNGNHSVHTSHSGVLKVVDESPVKDKDVIQRVVDQLASYNWNGNVCYVSDVVVPPGMRWSYSIR